MDRDNIMDFLRIEKRQLADDLDEVNDGKYMVRNKLIYLIEDLIEGYEELFPHPQPSTDFEKKDN